MSEVARLRRLIELETQSMQMAMNGYAEVARHEFIRVKHDNLERHRQALIEIVGEVEANRISAVTYFKALEDTTKAINVEVVKVGEGCTILEDHAHGTRNELS